MENQDQIIDTEQKVEREVAGAIWGGTTEAKAEPVAVAESVAEPIVEKKTEETIVDANEYLKTNLGFDNWEAAKKEVDELRLLRTAAKTPAEIEFANEASRQHFEAIRLGKEDEWYELVSQKKQIAKAEKLDVTNPKEAADLIKMTLHLKHKDLESYEVQDLFEEQYSKPEKPKQDVDQTDEEYDETVKAWQTKCTAIDRKIVRDAKLAKPELSQLNSQIVFPDIPKVEPVPEKREPSQEELTKFRNMVDGFNKDVEATISGLNSFDVAVKDGDVEIASSYVFTPEEKAFAVQKLKTFAEQGFNANNLFADRWVNEDNTFNVSRMIQDWLRLESGEKIDQKFAQDAAAKRMKQYKAEKKNINLPTTTATNNGGVDAVKAIEEVEAAIWGR